MMIGLERYVLGSKVCSLQFFTNIKTTSLLLFVMAYLYRRIFWRHYLEFVLVHSKGQLISKGLFGFLQFPQKTNEKFLPQ
jgi:hypothetical protein